MGILRYGAIQVLMAFHSSNFTGDPCHRGVSEASRSAAFIDLQGSGKAARDDRHTPDNLQKFSADIDHHAGTALVLSATAPSRRIIS